MDILVVSGLALMGWLMAPLPIVIIAGLLLATVCYTLILDQIKVPLLRKLTSA